MMRNVGHEENRIADFENVELRVERNLQRSLADHEVLNGPVAWASTLSRPSD